MKYLSSVLVAGVEASWKTSKSWLVGYPFVCHERTRTMSDEIPVSAVGLMEGSRSDSVTVVQDYLRQFGYLEGGPELESDEVFMRRSSDDHLLTRKSMPITGEIDEVTTEAIRAFQEFSGLEVSGQLDEATRETMNLKRCGLGDDTAELAEFTTGAGKWDTNNLTYSFVEFTPDIPNRAAIAWAIDQAFSLWSAETPLRFRRVGDGTSGDIVLRFVSGEHGDGAPFDGAGRVLAHAFYPSNSGPIRGDTHFDEAERWTIDIPTSGGVDLVTVAAHEIGHALGLRHSSNPNALMAPFYRGPRRYLDVDDIYGIQSLYGGPGRLENATWIHGNGALVEHPDRLESQRYYGFFNRLIGKQGTKNWIHFALPTPVIEDGRRLTMDRFMLRAVTGSAATLRDVHIRDGERVVALLNGVNQSGSMPFAKFGVASMPSVRWGISISLGFDFGSGSVGQRRVDLISAGFDYK